MIEAALIGSLVVILSFEYFAGFWHDLAGAFKANPLGIFKYFGSVAVFWLAIACLPTLLLSIYMRHHGFFAYEAFDVNRLSFQILSLNVFFDLAIVALVFLILALPLAWKWVLWPARLMLGLLAAFLFTALLVYSRASVAILAFGLLLGGYLYITLDFSFAKKAKRWWVPLVFAVSYLYLPVLASPWAADFVANQLYNMRVGAIDVEILDQPLSNNPGVPTPARLVLRTSEFYYMKVESDPQNLVIVKAESVAIKYRPDQGGSSARKD